MNALPSSAPASPREPVPGTPTPNATPTITTTNPTVGTPERSQTVVKVAFNLSFSSFFFSVLIFFSLFSFLIFFF